MQPATAITDTQSADGAPAGRAGGAAPGTEGHQDVTRAPCPCIPGGFDPNAPREDERPQRVKRGDREGRRAGEGRSGGKGGGGAAGSGRPGEGGVLLQMTRWNVGYAAKEQRRGTCAVCVCVVGLVSAWRVRLRVLC